MAWFVSALLLVGILGGFLVSPLVIVANDDHFLSSLWSRNFLQLMLLGTLEHPENLPIWESLLSDGAHNLQGKYDCLCRHWPESVFAAVLHHVKNSPTSAWTLLSPNCLLMMGRTVTQDQALAGLPTALKGDFDANDHLLAAAERNFANPARTWPLDERIIPIQWWHVVSKGYHQGPLRDIHLGSLVTPEAILRLAGEGDGLPEMLEFFILEHRNDSEQLLGVLETLLATLHLAGAAQVADPIQRLLPIVRDLLRSVISQIADVSRAESLEGRLARWMMELYFTPGSPVPQQRPQMVAPPELVSDGAFVPGTEGIAALLTIYDRYPLDPAQRDHYQVLLRSTMDDLSDKHWLRIMGLAGGTGRVEACWRVGGEAFFNRLMRISATGMTLEHPVWACLDSTQAQQLLVRRFQSPSTLPPTQTLLLWAADGAYVPAPLLESQHLLLEMLPSSPSDRPDVEKTLHNLLRNLLKTCSVLCLAISPLAQRTIYPIMRPGPSWNQLRRRERGIIRLVLLLQLHFPHLSYKMDDTYAWHLACHGDNAEDGAIKVLAVLYGAALCNVTRDP